MIEQAQNRVTLEQAIPAVRERTRLYRAYAGNAPFGVEIGHKTCFDHTRCSVVLGKDEFVKPREMSKIDFDVLHELGHMLQLFEDPAGYEKLIAVANEEYGRAKFAFYNWLLDVNVNSLIRLSAPQYREDKEFSPEVREYYSKELFPTRDFTARHFAAQYMDYLLNLGMGCADDIRLSPEVQKELQGPFVYLGRQYTAAEFLDRFLKAKVTENGVANLNVSAMRLAIDHVLRPGLERLLAADKREFPTEPGSGIIGSLTGDPSAMDNIIRAAKDAKADRSQTPEGRARAGRDKLLAEKYPDDPEYAERIGRNQSSIERFKAVLQRIRCEVQHYVHIDESPVFEGFELDVDEAIDQFADLSSNPPVMEDETVSVRTSVLPKKIRIAVVLDLSGSMDGAIKQVRDVLVTAGGAAISCNLEGEFTDEASGVTPVQYELGVYGYDDVYIPVLPFTAPKDFDQLLDAHRQVVSRGGTSSHTALQALGDELEKDKDAAGEALTIVLEVTDGDTTNPGLSHAQVERLKSLGAVVRGIKFGGMVGADAPPKPDPNAPVPMAPEPHIDRSHAASDSFEFIHGSDGLRIHTIDDFPAAFSNSVEDVIEAMR